MDKKTLAWMGAVAVGAVAAPPLALYSLGFGAGGIVAGSTAAVIQSKIGAVAAGSAFAACQSVGAAGLATGTKIGLGLIGGYIGRYFGGQ